jgi:tRNA/tmRNA/rRNA uracil-C5-methylase (TrmA/RlmC/RlmD family)
MERVTTVPDDRPAAGDELELDVGEVVHGGWCVSRQDDTGWVIFVRHALPGERVRARLTQVTTRFARADAVQVLVPSPDRVPAPCPYTGPGGCGGCDWQHVRLPAQRELKAAVVRQQLRRLAGLDLDVTVEALPGDEAGLHWRTVVAFAVDANGVAGLRRHRSREVAPISECLIAHPLVTSVRSTAGRWPGIESVQVGVVPATGERGVLVTAQRRARPDQLPPVAAESILLTGRSAARIPVRGRGYLTQRAMDAQWRVSLGGFWQVHPAAADTLADAVLDALDPQAGEAGLDLYCGAGLFAGVLARAVGPAGSVLAIEEDQTAVRHARHNLRAWPWAKVRQGDVARVLEQYAGTAAGAGLAVLDPPRTGVARAAIDALCRPVDEFRLRRIAYVSCDPATLARDLRLLLDGGWRIDGLRAFDAFPMTHHVECLASLSRA